MKSKVWAHRGASAYAPENTLEAFRLGAEQGADGVELDVQLSKDGQLVVIHDETIDRVSDGHGYVRDYSLEELKKFVFNKTHPEYADARIPTLGEVYDLLKPLGLEINVEIKTGLLYADGFQDVPGYAAGLGADALHPVLYNLQYDGFLEACREKNLLLHVWTVDDEKYMKLLVKEGIDAIITNKPDVARKIVDNT